MDGSGNDREAVSSDALELHLPTLLTRLDEDDPAASQPTLETLRSAIETAPEQFIPVAPKLRSLLANGAHPVHEDVAYCLAELAAESPSDVAPSTGEIISFAVDHPTHPATDHLLRCLAHLSVYHPDAVDPHTADLVSVLETRPEVDPWGLQVLKQLAADDTTSLDESVPTIIELYSSSENLLSTLEAEDQ